MKQLDGKTAIITGGGSGIGRGLALALAQEGANVIICGRRQVKLEETASEIQQLGGEVLAIKADVTLDSDILHLVETAMEKYHRVDILINNAGIGEGGKLYETDPDAWDRVMRTNLRGPYLAMRAVLPHMRRQGGGHIINISSESGLEYYEGDAVYGTSKHALNDLGEFVQRESQDYNIKVNTICPGMVVSEMTENEPNLDFEKCLYPEDIADLVIWLLSRRSNIKIGTPILIQTMLNPWK